MLVPVENEKQKKTNLNSIFDRIQRKQKPNQAERVTLKQNNIGFAIQWQYHITHSFL